MTDRHVATLLDRLRSLVGAGTTSAGTALEAGGRRSGDGGEQGVDALIEDVHRAVADLEAEVGALADELLERYEEITLLHELARDLVAVFEEDDVFATVLARAMQAIPAAAHGVAFLAEATGGLVPGCRDGSPIGPGELDLAASVASHACAQGSLALVHEGEQWAGERATASVLAVPLVTAQHQQSLGSLVLLGRAGARFTAGDAALGSTIGQQLARGVENERLITSLREKERIEREMELAGAVQRQLLPAQAPHVEGVSLAAACLPAEHVGGDYFDFVPSEHSVTALVADVSGHGVGPGLMMAMTRTVLRRELQQGVSLADALRATSTLMWDDLAATGLFITVFCIRYEPATRTLRYVNGGHHPALLRRAGGTTAGLDGDGWPLGLIPDPDFEEHSLVLDAGDAVLVFSDGIVEERSPTGEMFGTDRLTQLVTGTAGPLLQPLLDAARGWRGPALQQDDVTLLELRVAPEGDGR